MKLFGEDCIFANAILLSRKDRLFRISNAFRSLYFDVDYWEVTHDSNIFPDLNWNISQNITHVITNEIK